MKPARFLTLLSLGAALVLTPGSERIASADRDSHPVFKEHPGKHKGWDKHDKRHDRAGESKREHHHERYAHADHERHHAHRISSRTADGYWHHHDRSPRHFHYSRRPASVPPHHHGRENVRAEDRGRNYKPVIGKDYKAINDKRKEMRENRDELRKHHTELNNDRKELRRDIRTGASKDEIKKDREEIRADINNIRKTRQEMASDRAQLEAARRGR